MEKKGHWDSVAMLMARGDGVEGALGQSGNVNSEGRWTRRGTGTEWQC